MQWNDDEFLYVWLPVNSVDQLLQACMIHDIPFPDPADLGTWNRNDHDWNCDLLWWWWWFIHICICVCLISLLTSVLAEIEMGSIHHQDHHLSMQLIVINGVWPQSIEFQKMILILCSLCLYVETKTRYCEMTCSFDNLNSRIRRCIYNSSHAPFWLQGCRWNFFSVSEM